VKRHSEAVNIAIQYNTKPAALVWGGMKVLLEVGICPSHLHRAD
jgi:hypothetical protein